MKPGRTALFLLVVLLSTPRAFAQAPATTKHTEAPPTELADSIEALMATGGQHVAIGARALDFWWVKSLPLRSGSGDVSWASIDEGTLVGSVRIPAGYMDIRGKTIKAGVYTLRLGIQPADGNHLGVAANREFLLIAPAAVDDVTAATGHDKSIEMAKQTIGASHPGSWSLDPLSSKLAVGALQKNDMDQTAVIFEVPVSRDGKDMGTIKFGVVLVGTVTS